MIELARNKEGHNKQLAEHRTASLALHFAAALRDQQTAAEAITVSTSRCTQYQLVIGFRAHISHACTQHQQIALLVVTHCDQYCYSLKFGCRLRQERSYNAVCM
jgi:hypothetical protein